MTKRLAGTDPVRRLLFGVLLGVALCGCAGPPKQEYVLGAATAPKAASVVQTALPVVQIERVLLPDYLDTRDILTRRDGRVVPSEFRSLGRATFGGRDAGACNVPRDTTYGRCRDLGTAGRSTCPAGPGRRDRL